MQPGSSSVGAAPPGSGGNENQLAALGTIDFVATALLSQGFSTNALLAENAEHIAITVQWVQPAVNASLSYIALTVR